MKVIVFLADGFEEVEALTAVDYLRRKNIEVETLSITDMKTVEGAHNIAVIADKLLSQLENISSYDGIIIPGGLRGAENLRDNENVIEVIKKANQDNKLLAAICAAPIVLERAGVIKGKKITSYPGFEEQLKDSIYQNQTVVTDGNIITSRGPALAVDFALEIIKYLLGNKKAEELKKDILYKN